MHAIDIAVARCDLAVKSYYTRFGCSPGYAGSDGFGFRLRFSGFRCPGGISTPQSKAQVSSQALARALSVALLVVCGAMVQKCRTCLEREIAKKAADCPRCGAAWRRFRRRCSVEERQELAAMLKYSLCSRLKALMRAYLADEKT